MQGHMGNMFIWVLPRCRFHKILPRPRKFSGFRGPGESALTRGFRRNRQKNILRLLLLYRYRTACWFVISSKIKKLSSSLLKWKKNCQYKPNNVRSFQQCFRSTTGTGRWCENRCGARYRYHTGSIFSWSPLTRYGKEGDAYHQRFSFSYTILFYHQAVDLDPLQIKRQRKSWPWKAN